MLREMTFRPATTRRDVVRLGLTSGSSGPMTSMIREYYIPNQLEEYYISGRINDEWEIVQPINIIIEKEFNLFIVSDRFSLVYGDGNTLYAAIEDYKRSLVDYYQLIDSSIENHSHNQQIMENLQLYICHNPV